MKVCTVSQRALMAAALGVTLSFGALANDNTHSKMDMMDANNDGKITASEHAAGAQKMFAKMDANGDGRVTSAEMDAAHPQKKGDAHKGDSDKSHPMTSAADKIKAVDSNGDGAISAEEHATASRLKFDQMDTDHDGTLSSEELKAGHAKMMK